MKKHLVLALGSAMILAAPLHAQEDATVEEKTAPAKQVEAEAVNPFDAPSTLPYLLPPFDKIGNEDFAPAFEKGMAEQRVEIDAIAESKEAPTFQNTLVAMEKSGQLLTRVSAVFYNLVGANTNDDLNKIQVEMAPKLSAHNDAIVLNGKLFQRLSTIYDARDTLKLDAQDQRLLKRYYLDFVRAGARLSEDDKTKLKAINSELSSLQTTFSQNLLKESNDLAVVVVKREELAGLAPDTSAAATEAAKERKLDGKYVLALQNTSNQPPLSSLENRALRERIHEASVSRGSRGNEWDNRAVLSKVVKLRAERAKLLGYPNHAAYVLEDETAGNITAVNKLMADMVPAAVANAKREAAAMQAIIDAEKGGFQLAPWDWSYYAEKVRKAKYAFDASQLRPYFEIDNVLQNGVFFAANKLYGLSFKERKDLPTYQEDVRVFEVFDADGKPLALFLADFYARGNKRGGAWMNEYVTQSDLFGFKPVVANHLNVPKPPKGEPTLLTFDEANTMFHEFGHALHGMFSASRYPRLSGTNVPRDFVEYPSQVNEMWATWPEVLKNYAKHYQTGELVPQELLDKVIASQSFNQGFSTTEYLGAAMLDQAYHQIGADEAPTADGVLAFEAAALKKAGVDYEPVPPRYRSTYFSHIMGGYSAGYYAYLWSEVLDADSVEWFKENGGLTRKNGDHFRNTLLSRGGTDDAMNLFRAFRGREPEVKPLLERRGLLAAPEVPTVEPTDDKH